MRRLFSGSPFNTTGPLSPPLKKSAGVERFSLAICISPPWQAKHLLDNSGRILLSKNSFCSALACGLAATKLGSPLQTMMSVGRTKNFRFNMLRSIATQERGNKPQIKTVEGHERYEGFH